MTVKVPPTLRLVVYLANVLGGPLATYLYARHVIGQLELGLWSAEVAAMATLAAVNLRTSGASDRPEAPDA